jgi:regulator of sigma E protease
MVSILSFIVVLGVLIFVHELGHFIVAKLLGVGVEKFSLGFGPKLIGRKIGQTEYLLSALPLGGYVKMVGEGDEAEVSEEEQALSFAGKSPLRRIAIVVAGPFSNLLFAMLIYVTVFMAGIPVPTARIGEVVKDKPAARAGLKADDLITAINGKQVKKWEDFAAVVQDGKGEPVDLQVKRGTASFSLRVVPETQSVKNLFGETVTTPLIGVKASKETFVERLGPVAAVISGGAQTWFYIKLTLLSIVKIFERVVSFDTLGGPIMIAVMSGQQAAAGAVSFFAFMALLSVNLGVLNLLPIPILDGGHLFFFFYELIFRKPMGMKTREKAQQVGMVLLISLMVFATYNDLHRYWPDIVKFIFNIF